MTDKQYKRFTFSEDSFSSSNEDIPLDVVVIVHKKPEIKNKDRQAIAKKSRIYPTEIKTISKYCELEDDVVSATETSDESITSSAISEDDIISSWSKGSAFQPYNHYNAGLDSIRVYNRLHPVSDVESIFSEDMTSCFEDDGMSIASTTRMYETESEYDLRSSCSVKKVYRRDSCFSGKSATSKYFDRDMLHSDSSSVVSYSSNHLVKPIPIHPQLNTDDDVSSITSAASSYYDSGLDSDDVRYAARRKSITRLRSIPSEENSLCVSEDDVVSQSSPTSKYYNNRKASINNSSKGILFKSYSTGNLYPKEPVSNSTGFSVVQNVQNVKNKKKSSESLINKEPDIVVKKKPPLAPNINGMKRYKSEKALSTIMESTHVERSAFLDIDTYKNNSDLYPSRLNELKKTHDTDSYSSRLEKKREINATDKSINSFLGQSYASKTTFQTNQVDSIHESPTLRKSISGLSNSTFYNSNLQKSINETDNTTTTNRLRNSTFYSRNLLNSREENNNLATTSRLSNSTFYDTNLQKDSEEKDKTKSTAHETTSLYLTQSYLPPDDIRTIINDIKILKSNLSSNKRMYRPIHGSTDNDKRLWKSAIPETEVTEIFHNTNDRNLTEKTYHRTRNISNTTTSKYSTVGSEYC